MAYAKQTWQDGKVGGTPLDAARLNHMEDGIEGAHADLTGRLSDAELRAAFGRLPAYAGSRSGPFDVERSLYNFKASNTRRTRAKMAAAKAGTGRCHIACFGDSLTKGFGGTAGVSDYPTLLRTALADRGYAIAGTGFVPVWNNGDVDPQWSIGGGWSGPSVVQPFYVSYGPDTMTFTSNRAGTVVEIATYGITTAFTYKIDGGAPVTMTPNGQDAVQIVTVTGLPNTTHTVLITSGGGSGTYITSAGVRSANGLIVSNFGINGSTTTNWIANNSWFGPQGTALGTIPDVVLLELGINDAGQSVDIDTFQGQLEQMVSAARTAGAEVWLAASNSSQVGTISQATWDARLARIYTVADLQDVPLLDLTDRFGRYPEALANGVMFDVTHLNPAGYADKARAWATALTA